MRDGSDVDHQEIIKRNQRDIQARLDELNEEIVFAPVENVTRLVGEDQDDDDYGAGGSIPTELTNYYHLAYIGDLYLGKQANGKG